MIEMFRRAQCTGPSREIFEEIAMSAATQNMSLGRPVAGSGLLRRLLARLMRARRFQVQRRLLRDLPDHLLKDIGLTRCNLDYVAQAIVDKRADPTRRRSFR
jgi:uncharacterized protein YjiS (DUF1127 family)